MSSLILALGIRLLSVASVGKKGRALPKDFRWDVHLCIQRLHRKVKADGCILLDKHRYFVGTHLVRCWVELTLEEENVNIVDGDTIIAIFKKAA